MGKLIRFPYFSPEEMECHDSTPYPEDLSDIWNYELGPMLGKIRTKWQGSIVIVDGYRSPAHNKALVEADNKKGSHQVASGSRHVLGEAADIRPMIRSEVPQLYRIILGMHDNGNLPELGGIAMYPMSGWVHVDVYKVDHLRKWVGT